jgi:hypothetical protein
VAVVVVVAGVACGGGRTGVVGEVACGSVDVAERERAGAVGLEESCEQVAAGRAGRDALAPEAGGVEAVADRGAVEGAAAVAAPAVPAERVGSAAGGVAVGVVGERPGLAARDDCAELVDARGDGRVVAVGGDGDSVLDDRGAVGVEVEAVEPGSGLVFTQTYLPPPASIVARRRASACSRGARRLTADGLNAETAASSPSVEPGSGLAFAQTYASLQSPGRGAEPGERVADGLSV